MKRVIFLLLLMTPPPLLAEVRLPSLISDHMVFQRDLPLRIWGWADPSERVRVSLRDQTRETRAGADGAWGVQFNPMSEGGPFQIRIEGTNTLTVSDVLIGEVWIASGQSNMWWPVRLSKNSESEIASARYPDIRLFTVEQKVSDQRLSDVNGQWQGTTPESVADFSAVAYYFGRKLHQDLQMPIGLIHTSWGGTPAEAWTSRRSLEADLSLQPILWNWRHTLFEYPYLYDDYQAELKAWEEEAAKAQREGTEEPREPRRPRGPGHPWTPSGLFNAMIAPLTQFAIRGAIWYQGEANARPLRSYQYRRLFPTMIRDWRQAWNLGPFPFLFVQLANYRQKQPDPSQSTWAELQEAQRMTLALPNTGMAVTADLGEADDIHPRNKQDVGKRLALAARKVAYGEDIVASGPLYEGMILEPGQVRILFEPSSSSLVLRNNGARSFAVAGRDGQFQWAEARIEGDTLVVSSPEIANPVAVRYAWADNPDLTLYNQAGLPASPFRTDNWSVENPPEPPEDPVAP